MKNRWAFGVLALVSAFAFAAPAAEKIFHIDFNSASLKHETISDMLKVAAESGYTAVLWEIEDKVRLDTIPDCISPEAMTKLEFRELLAESRALGLKAIPLMQTFGHAEYVLKNDAYRGLREVPYRHDCYCVLKPETKDFLKRLLAEYLELFREADVKWFHLGGDEAVAFGSCPVCSKRRDLDVYAEHLNFMAEALRARNIRPCIWSDMIVDPKRRQDIDLLPKDFVVFHWDYYLGVVPGASRSNGVLPFLLDHGFNVVFTSSASCGGDGAIMPDLRYHRLNILKGIELTKKYGLDGHCVSSWSIRQTPKHMQIPLIRLGGDGVWTIGPEYDALTRWSPKLCDLDGRGWHPFKDSTVPPPGYVDQVLETADRTDPEFRKNAIALASEIRAGVVASLPKVSGRWKEGGELEVALLDCILAVLKKEPIPEVPFERHVRYLAEEQAPQSALNAAKIVWGLYR